ncbi:MAG: hypothetical protein ACYC3A_10780, partial [Halothiobacillus sp.]
MAKPGQSHQRRWVRQAYPNLNAHQVQQAILTGANKTFASKYQENTCGASGKSNCGTYYFGAGMLDIKGALLA